MIGLIKNYKYYLVGMTALSLIIFGMSMGRRITKTTGRLANNVYGRIEEMKQVRHLELVSYYYESMVEVEHEEKSDRAFLLLIIPAKVSCYLDLEKAEFVVVDTLVRIILPEPELEKPVLELDSARVFNLNQRDVTASKHAYETVVRNVQRAMSVATRDVLQRAEACGIREEALRLGRGYFESLIWSLGYDVEFVETGRQPSVHSPQSSVHLNQDDTTGMPADYIIRSIRSLGETYLRAAGSLTEVQDT